MNPVQKMYFYKKMSTIEYLINLANIKVKSDINSQNLLSRTIDYIKSLLSGSNNDFLSSLKDSNNELEELELTA
jgi:endonuclease III